MVASSFEYVWGDLYHAEDLALYQPGGFHPVHLGDLYDAGRYKVLHKLGHDSCSTTWLVRDQLLDSYVALKVIAADASGSNCKDLQMREFISSIDTKDPGRTRIASDILHQFWLDGPNGHHFALVVPAYGPSLSTTTRWQRKRIARIAHQVALEVTEGVAFLHSIGIGHGGMYMKCKISQQEN